MSRDVCYWMVYSPYPVPKKFVRGCAGFMDQRGVGPIANDNYFYKRTFLHLLFNNKTNFGSWALGSFGSSTMIFYLGTTWSPFGLLAIYQSNLVAEDCGQNGPS